MADTRIMKLPSGHDCPLVGYGTFQASNTEQLKTALKAAIKAGYRHIDTAKYYQNEHVIGETLQELYAAGVVKREDIFLTTKLAPVFARRAEVVQVLKEQLKDLRTSYVDLYLVHFPILMKNVKGNLFPFGANGKILLDTATTLEETWAGMEDCAKAGLARSIGISNYNISQVERMLKTSTIKPCMNQIEVHPLFQNKKLIDFCQKNGVAVTAFAQFGSPGTISPATGKPLSRKNVLDDDRLKKIGAKYGKNSAQVILRWLRQKNIFSIPKSTTPERVAENFNIWDFELSSDDMKVIEGMDEDKRFFLLDFCPGFTESPEFPHVQEGSC